MDLAITFFDEKTVLQPAPAKSGMHSIGWKEPLYILQGATVHLKMIGIHIINEGVCHRFRQALSEAAEEDLHEGESDVSMVTAPTPELISHHVNIEIKPIKTDLVYGPLDGVTRVACVELDINNDTDSPILINAGVPLLEFFFVLSDCCVCLHSGMIDGALLNFVPTFSGLIDRGAISFFEYMNNKRNFEMWAKAFAGGVDGAGIHEEIAYMREYTLNVIDRSRAKRMELPVPHAMAPPGEYGYTPFNGIDDTSDSEDDNDDDTISTASTAIDLTGSDFSSDTEEPNQSPKRPRIE